MFETAKELIEKCESENKSIADIVVEYQTSITQQTKYDIMNELYKVIEVMKNSALHFTTQSSKTTLGMIDGFAYKMMNYANIQNSICGKELCSAMAMAFSTLEMSANMHKIVAAPTAGASGILPAALVNYANKYNTSDEELANALLVSAGIGEFIANFANFSGAEGGCQAECGSASAMAAAALVYLHGGTVTQCLHASSFAILHVLGLICDPIAGLVEYPCTFRNASGVVNAMISADMALAGITSIVPFEEVVKTMKKVGDEIPASSRETGLGGIAASETGCKIRSEFFK